ncbi:D-alanyl-D-alanine carboxypeptidase [Paenibacillus sp. MWE-103]|uniref:D-alanyl-D-alanine carboxypeptidase n=1 Tax=Paenibacillus artemisiicola TaxID=1172618 RepID=A0ABS3W2M0_9BACL|nr:D-alanyl-D-alanine carboxypeptidase family protein [Paenibacillus artemisiicola]MBO7742566.1 D-alanyl-D-alanine carboxypeptidase [Paenibacillus artemisiicola]
MKALVWKRRLAALLVLASFGWASPVRAETADDARPELASEAAVLIDAKTGTVLYARNPDEQEYPASITKIVTGIIAIEDVSDLAATVTVSKEARGEDGTRVYLAEGEKLPLLNLLYGMLMNSGNDAATAIAEYVDGSKAKFAERMNAFAKDKAGAANTHFVNPSGLPDPRQYTTAMDMAKIARYAMQNELFRTIVGTKRMPWNGEEWKSELINHNEMLGRYEGTTGVKNGYTGDAGFTLVTSAKRGGMELIGVLLKSPTKSLLYKDMTKLLDYGFDRFALQQVTAANPAYPLAAGAEFVRTGPLYAVVPRGETPAVSVLPDGEVRVRTSLGVAAAGRLRPAVPSLAAIAARYPAVKAAELREDDGGKRAREPGSAKKAEIFVVWVGMLVYLALIAAIRAKRHRLERERSF